MQTYGVEQNSFKNIDATMVIKFSSPWSISVSFGLSCTTSHQQSKPCQFSTFSLPLMSCLSIFYHYFHGYCLWKSRILFLPDPVRHVQTTRSSILSHPFKATLPNSQTLAHISSFIPRTSQLWNSLLSTIFLKSYNLSSFKPNITKLDLVSLST